MTQLTKTGIDTTNISPVISAAMNYQLIPQTELRTDRLKLWDFGG
jgi:hypothetical protein